MVEVEGVSKTYLPPPTWLRPLVRTATLGPVPALEDITFSVREGEIVGLVGSNGAGKTTLIKILTTLLEPSAGRAFIGGIDVSKDAAGVRQRIGVQLAEDRGLYHRLTGRQNLEFFGALSGVPTRDIAERATEMLESARLADADKLVFGYSSGMRARLALAAARMGEPDLLVLDEPTRSLDPATGREFLRDLRREADAGRSVLLASHRLEELVEVTDRVVVLAHGRVRFQGRPGSLADGTSAQAAALIELMTEAGP